MSDKNFINYHILISHSPSCLNRDDMGMQKTAVFGGVRRVRISSQSLKRAIRKSKYYATHFKNPSVRTKHLGWLLDKSKEELSDKYSEEIITSVILEISGVKDIQEDTKSGAVAAWSVSEIDKYCELYQKLKTENKNEKEFEKAWEKTTKKENFKKFNDAFQNSMDIALSGRMATSGIMTTIDAAMSVAHVITTHAVDGDIDWFTAVDDLTREHGDTGAAHLDTQEFSAGVFYRFASLNIGQLQENLGKVDRDKALDIAAHLLHMIATVVPEAKQNSTGAYNMADFACISFSDQPVSLANAFESPVKAAESGGFTQPSIDAFAEYKDKIYKGYGLQDDVGFFSLKDVSMEGEKQDTLAKLEEWVRNNGKEPKDKE